MNKDLGFSASVFGFGGSLFFAGYLLLQIPGTLAINRFGARRVMMVMTLTWGIVATGMAFVWNESSFYAMRALLGAAESAFFPGAIFYISLWFPAAYRTRMMAFFLLANPLSAVIGFPLSAALIQLQGVLGLTGWQWVFIGEGLPAVALAALALKHLTDVPQKADWLAPEERQWLINTMAADMASRPHGSARGISRAIFSRSAIALAVGYFGIIMGIYGLNLWLPQLVRQFGFSIAQTGLVAALPYVAASVAMLIAGLRHPGKRTMAEQAAIAALVACIGLVASALNQTAAVSLIALSVAAMGLYFALSAFWTIPTTMFAGTGGAAVIGFVSSMGHVGGFAGPLLMGLFRDLYNSFAFGLCGLALGLLITAWVAWTFRGSSARHLVPTVAATAPAPRS
ncbi:MFS transporter [Bradyrhizobium sp. STM 3562]|uniref:MFS transporter n=1 Tax=Bradyrhizobium sp. STM 3562 TaxID=578924 RepID=UPI00388FD5A0